MFYQVESCVKATKSLNLQSFIHSIIHLVNIHLCLLYTSHCSNSWGYHTILQKTNVPTSKKLLFQWKKQKVNKHSVSNNKGYKET